MNLCLPAISSAGHAATVLTILYVVSPQGASFSSLTRAADRGAAMGLLTVLIGLWWAVRAVRGWRWHATTLDWLLPLCAGAIALSIAANPDTARRSLIAMWYLSVYLLVWYALHDLLANQVFTRDLLVDGLLLAGGLVLLHGAQQIVVWAQTTLPLMLNGSVRPDFPRVPGTLDNSNALGTFLLVLLPLAALRVIKPRFRGERLLMLVYTVGAALLLLSTFSRGAWLGAAAATLLPVLMLIFDGRAGGLTRLRNWWDRNSRHRQQMLKVSGLALAVALVLVGVFFLSTFQIGGRTVDMRTSLWEDALHVFAAQPITGGGLFTFGAHLMQRQSIPPVLPHSHTHSLPLLVLAELGLVGAGVFGITGGVCLRALWLNWRQADKKQRPLLLAVAAALTGYAVHHLLDTTCMSPAIALCGVLLLVLACAPPAPPAANNWWNGGVLRGGITVLSLGVVLSGVWSTALYAQYSAVLNTAADNQDYAAGAAALQSVIDADPGMDVYLLEQAYLYGLAAGGSGASAAQSLLLAVEGYERLLRQFPYHAISWANLSALYWQQGESEQAYTAMQQAHQLAPLNWQFTLLLGGYAEALGDVASATNLYAGIHVTDVGLYPLWQETSLRRDVAASIPRSSLGETLFLLLDGQVDAARQVWVMNDLAQENTSSYQVVGALLALADGDQEAALHLLEVAESSAYNPQTRAWAALGRARYALAAGDRQSAATAIAAAQNELRFDPWVSEDAYSALYPPIHYLRGGYARLYLPQLNYPFIDPLLAALLDNTIRQTGETPDNPMR